MAESETTRTLSLRAAVDYLHGKVYRSRVPRSMKLRHRFPSNAHDVFAC
jgi:hypothetical protein